MPLRSCPHCEKRVSVDAPHCPYCGGPIVGKKTEHTTGFGAILVVLSLLVAVPSALAAIYFTGSTLIAAGAFLAPVIAAMIYASMPKAK
jgi:hypothetical protein